MTARLIAIDWGTTSFRAAVADGSGNAIERSKSAHGILADDGAFADVLRTAVAPLRERHGPLPILMAGMIGSRQGWREAPYVHAPAGLDELAGNLLRFEAPDVGPVAIVPGVDTRHPGGAPDVMRGEETQIHGALQRLGISGGTFAMPGTHAKWVTVADHRIVDFRTYMTGEVFAALKGHTILGRMMARDGGISDAGFRRGIAASADNGLGPGGLLSRIFSTRTLGLFGELAPEDAAGYLSGLLIGSEMREGLRQGAREIVIAGSHELEEHYKVAADELGVAAILAPPDCAVPGLVAIARRAGLIGDEP
ncbi:MAG TPA: 2-dehydro-3-deoxygalactonokinase [Hyphomicrobiaceae bacterium]|nr:2-dehydro-3-deoxygalactonokinase [Hyphomicrobiaceae bacterium]